jgi:hypothetical protein
MKPLGRFCSAGLLLMWTGLAGAQETAAAVATPMGGTLAKRQVSFTFDRKAVAVSHYKLVVHEDGSGLYEGNEIPSATSYGHPADVSAVPFKHVITVSQATAQKIFSTAERLNRFDVPCASKLKNIADTGTKTLVYEGRDGAGSCMYNYSENKDVQLLTDTFQGIAETLDTGRRLDQLHRFDRLGLDAAMKSLTDEVSSGRALEIGTIARSLRSIAQDTNVMTRVRNRATALLSQIPSDVAAP